MEYSDKIFHLIGIFKKDFPFNWNIQNIKTTNIHTNYKIDVG
jgi:hypothetical protein